MVTTAKAASGRLSSRSNGTLTADTMLGMVDAGQHSVCQMVERSRCTAPETMIILLVLYAGREPGPRECRRRDVGRGEVGGSRWVSGSAAQLETGWFSTGTANITHYILEEDNMYVRRARQCCFSFIEAMIS